MDLAIYFHRKDFHCLAFDRSEQVRSGIPRVSIHGRERDFCQLRVIPGGIHLSDPENEHLKLDDATHCRLESR